MNPTTLLFVLVALTIVAYLVSLVYVIGIVWRVELELDVAYKFLALAVLFLVMAELIGVLPVTEGQTAWLVILRATRFLAALNLFFGMYFMRNLVRRVDGEVERKIGL